MRIQYQFELATGLCTLELNVMVRDNQFHVTTGVYTSPVGVGEHIEAAVLDFLQKFKQSCGLDWVNGSVFQNLPLPAAADTAITR